MLISPHRHAGQAVAGGGGEGRGLLAETQLLGEPEMSLLAEHAQETTSGEGSCGV